MRENPDPLPYRDREADTPERERQQYLTVGAAVIALVTVFGCGGVVWMMWNLRVGTPPPINWRSPALFSAGALAGIVTLGVLAWNRGDRAVPWGLLIGTALGLLCEGFCYVKLS
jgi:hypothetical protein